MATARGQFDEKTKTEVVRKILAGEMTIQEAMAKFGVQSYQLHAWIGYVVVEQAAIARATPAEVARRMAEAGAPAAHHPAMPDMGMGAIPMSPLDKRKIVEWYIRTVVLPESTTTKDGG